MADVINIFSTESIMREIILQLWIKKKHYSSDMHEFHCQTWIECTINLIPIDSILIVLYFTHVYSQNRIIIFSVMNLIYYELLMTNLYSDNIISYNCELE